MLPAIQSHNLLIGIGAASESGMTKAHDTETRKFSAGRALLQTAMLFCLVCLGAVAFPLRGAESFAASEPVAPTVDEALARQCLKLAASKDKSAGSAAIAEKLRGLEHKERESLAVLVRKELGNKAADAIAVPPRGDLSAAWLCNFLDAKAETLAFDLAEEGRFVRWLEPGRRCRFRTFGKQELVVHVNASTLGYESLQKYLEAYSRVYLRKIPGSGDYYAASWRWLIKHRQPPPAPNPEGRYVPFLMDLGLPAIQSPYGGASTSATPFVRAFTERMRSPDRAARLEAYFRSVGLPALPEYVGILRQALVDGDALERLTALYALAAMTRHPDDIDAFLNAFPTDPELFSRFFYAEWDLSGTQNTGVANFLLLLVYERRTQERALPCLARLAYTNVCGPAEFLAPYREDPLVAEYMAGHKESLLARPPDDRTKELRPLTDWDEFMLPLIRSDNLLTAATAVLMEATSLCPEKSPEVLRLQGALFEPLVVRFFDRPRFVEIFPFTAKELADLLSVEKQVYRPPLKGVAAFLVTSGADRSQLQALLAYGRDFLEEYELQRLKSILKENN